MKLETRMDIERKIVRKLVRVMKKHGWVVEYVNNGGEAEVCKTEKAVMNAVFAGDDARIYFKNAAGRRHWAFIVLGNDGYDCICDYSFCADNGDDFDTIMQAEIDPYCDSFLKFVDSYPN